jgi:hypothetical protein
MSKTKSQISDGAEKVTAPSPQVKQPTLNTNPAQQNASREQLKRAAASRTAANRRRR